MASHSSQGIDDPLADYAPLEALSGIHFAYNLDLSMDAPWFCAQGVLKRAEILGGYVGGNHFLPGNLRLRLLIPKIG